MCAESGPWALGCPEPFPPEDSECVGHSERHGLGKPSFLVIWALGLFKREKNVLSAVLFSIQRHGALESAQILLLRILGSKNMMMDGGRAVLFRI